MKRQFLLSENLVLSKIHTIRDCKVMLDEELASLYGVETRRLNEQVRRNISRFPEDFMFQLTSEEYKNLISHFATSRWGGRRKPPFAFTEHGVLMLSSVLNSDIAIQVNIQIVRVYSKMKKLLHSHQEILTSIDHIEQKLLEHNSVMERHDDEIRAVFETIKHLIEPEKEKPRKRIGFKID